jgi:putative toxin-antitoxin system antitoxin component (TIGR02293 family)
MAGQLASVETLLGVRSVNGENRLGLARSILNGLPVSTIERLATMVAPDDRTFKWRLIPKATFERRKRSLSKLLTTEEGDRLARLAKVFSFALEIYKEPAPAREFLSRPHAMLDGETPLNVALGTGPGADVVINLLGRAAYGGGA